MKCANCESEWQPSGKASITITKCPFCGENPHEKKEEPASFDNSKDALAAIHDKLGADILLGKLSAYFSDFAPSVNINIKKLVLSVYDSGASKALKENLNGSADDKDRAVKIAVRCLTDAFIAQEMAEKIVYEFTDALGWKVKKPAAGKTADEPAQQKQSKQSKQNTQSKNQKPAAKKPHDNKTSSSSSSALSGSSVVKPSASKPKEAEKPQPPAKQEYPSGIGRGKKAMIIDDSVFVAKQMEQILASEGFEVVAIAADGAQGVQKYKELQANIDLIMLDLIMPVMDGITALKKILEVNENAKVVIVSALGQDDLVKKSLLMGARSYVKKPLEPKAVLNRVYGVVK